MENNSSSWWVFQILQQNRGIFGDLSRSILIDLRQFTPLDHIFRSILLLGWRCWNWGRRPSNKCIDSWPQWSHCTYHYHFRTYPRSSQLKWWIGPRRQWVHCRNLACLTTLSLWCLDVAFQYLPWCAVVLFESASNHRINSVKHCSINRKFRCRQCCSGALVIAALHVICYWKLGARGHK